MSLAMPLRSPISQGPGPVRRSTRLAGNPTPDSTPRAATRRARPPIDTTPPRNHTAHRAAKEQRRPAPPASNKRKSPEDDKRVVKKRKENATRTVKPTPRASTNRYATRSAPCRASSPLVEDSEKISTVHVQSVPIAPIDELPVVDVDIDLQTAPTPSVHAEEPAVSVLPDTQEESDVVIALAPAAREDETDAQQQSSSASAYVTYTDLSPSPSPASPPAHTTGLESPTPAFENDAMDLDTADFVMGPVPSTSRLPLADAPMPISIPTEMGDIHAGQFDNLPSLQCASSAAPPTESTLDLDLDAPDFSSASLMTAEPHPHQTLSEHQSEHDMRQREYEAAERARKRASQRQDRLWLAWAGGRIAAMVSRYGMDEVRRIEWARARAGASSSSAAAEFEMYTPHSDREREDFEWDCDEYDEDEDDDEDEVEDIVPEPNFEFLPAPSSPPPVASHNSTLTVAHTYPDASYSRGSASPAPTTPPARRESVRGTPPFLERRQAWGGTNLIVRSLLPSAALQRPRPPPLSLDDPMEGCGRLRLTYPGESMEEHHHPSPAMSVPSNAPAEAADATDPSESFADPAIMQAIIASMNNNAGAAHGHGSLSPPPSPSHQDVEYASSQQTTFGAWGVPSPSSPPPSSLAPPSSPAVGEWSFSGMGAGMGMGGMGMGMEAGWYSSSSTLHSALG